MATQRLFLRGILDRPSGDSLCRQGKDQAWGPPCVLGLFLLPAHGETLAPQAPSRPYQQYCSPSGLEQGLSSVPLHTPRLPLGEKAARAPSRPRPSKAPSNAPRQKGLRVPPPPRPGEDCAPRLRGEATRRPQTGGVTSAHKHLGLELHPLPPFKVLPTPTGSSLGRKWPRRERQLEPMTLFSNVLLEDFSFPPAVNIVLCFTVNEFCSLFPNPAHSAKLSLC